MKKINEKLREAQNKCMRDIVNNISREIFCVFEPIEVCGKWGGVNCDYTQKKDDEPALLCFNRNLFNQETPRALIKALLEGAMYHYVACNNLLPIRGADYKKNIRFEQLAKTFKIHTTVGGRSLYSITGYDKSYSAYWAKELKEYKEARDIYIKESKKSLIPYSSTASYKYFCPKCNSKLTATSKANLICGDCFARMQMESKEVNDNG